jgi:hypothetical protein
MSEIENLSASIGLLRREVKDVRAVAAHIENRTRNLNQPSAIRRPGGLCGRAAACWLIGLAEKRSPLDVCRQHFGGDYELNQWMTRAASSPASTTTSGFGAELAQVVVADIADNLLPASVLVQLRNMGLAYEFVGGASVVRVPFYGAAPSGSFTTEGAPIAVPAMVFSSISLRTKKCASIIAITRELLQGGPANVETSLRELLAADIGLAVDSILLGNGAATTAQPQGLLFGLTTLGATAGGGAVALLGDLKKLLDAIAPSVRPTLIVSSTQAASIGVLAQSALPTIVAPSLAAGTVVCVDAAAFVSAMGGLDFEVSQSATLHMEDNVANVLPISSVGTPNTVAAPVRSLFQTASIGLRTLMDCDWALRRSSAVAFISGTTW